MPKNSIARKTTRIASMAAVLGAAAALLLVGAPADAAQIGTLGRGVVHTFGRGV